MTRDEIEQAGRSHAQILFNSDSYRKVRVLGSFDLFVNPHDISLTPHLTQDGFWEAWIASWFTKWVRPGMSVLDVGANCGYYTMIAERLVGQYGEVVAYEPNPEYSVLLRLTKQVNSARFKVISKALTDEPDGNIQLTVPANYHGSASIVSDFLGFEQTKTFNVPQTSLNKEKQRMTFTRHDVVKIDAEGAEEQILNGAAALLIDRYPTTFIFEHTPGAYSSDFYDNIFKNVVSFVNAGGDEERITRDWLLNQSDLCMIVMRDT